MHQHRSGLEGNNFHAEIGCNDDSTRRPLDRMPTWQAILQERGWAMNESEEVLCPYCGQSMELLIDTTVRNQRFTTDCEVCCRPFEVIVECDDGEVVSLDTQA